MLLKVVEYNGTHMDVDLLNPSTAGDFHTGVAASVFVTVMSELGDKSFFMSAILAMHHSRTLTFIGSMLGQIIMTGVAVILGLAASLVPDVYTKWASCICMTFFGLKMLKDGSDMPLEGESSLDHNENLKITISEKNNESSQTKVNVEILKNHSTLQSCEITTTNNMKEKRQSKSISKQGSRRNSNDGVLIQAFTLSFLGEWGDRSQIATILLASNENPYGVAVGSVFGHIVCSLMAVIGGRIIGQKFPVKTMTQAGGVVFLLCAASAIVFE